MNNWFLLFAIVLYQYHRLASILSPAIPIKALVFLYFTYARNTNSLFIFQTETIND